MFGRVITEPSIKELYRGVYTGLLAARLYLRFVQDIRRFANQFASARARLRGFLTGAKKKNFFFFFRFFAAIVSSMPPLQPDVYGSSGKKKTHPAVSVAQN